MGMVHEDAISCKQIVASTLWTTYTAAGYPKIIKATLKTDTRCANPSVIRAVLDLSTSGHPNGLGQALMSEVICPNGSLARGELASLTCSLNSGASSTWGSAGPVEFQRYQIDGGGAAYINSNAYFWKLDGFTEGSGKMFSEAAATTVGNLAGNASTLKIYIQGVGIRYLVLADAEAN